jgi:hypothetical protein
MGGPEAGEKGVAGKKGLVKEQARELLGNCFIMRLYRRIGKRGRSREQGSLQVGRDFNDHTKSRGHSIATKAWVSIYNGANSVSMLSSNYFYTGII